MISRLPRNVRPVWVLVAIMAVSSTATMLAMRRTSTTFDEIVLIAGGARGYNMGEFDLAPDHPPLMQYIYGLPVYLTHPRYPSDAGYDTHEIGYRYLFSRRFFWESGNNPFQMAFLGRFPAVLVSMLLVFTMYAFTRRRAGHGAALLAATLVAFLPDVLAHGGVAYNDMPIALTFFVALWTMDVALREPSWQTGILAGMAVGLAFGVKMSAVGLAPAAFLLFGLEAVARAPDLNWFLKARRATAFAIVAAYLTLVIIYRGDFALVDFRYALGTTFRHVTKGHGAAAFLLGKSNPAGFWYFYPVAFLYKTSAALHLLLAIAIAGALRAQRRTLRELCASPLRVPIVILIVFGLVLLTSSLDIGFRYALPILPPLCVLIAVGVARMWRTGPKRLRALIVALIAWVIISPLTYYPNFLAYISEYGPGRDRGSEVLVDSSLDWGQGLIQLRDYLRANQIDRIYLSYFGSARPDGYGIDYMPFQSFFPLAPSALARPKAPDPKYIVISATNLAGGYFLNDPFKKFRSIQPDAVVAHTMYVYRIHE